MRYVRPGETPAECRRSRRRTLKILALDPDLVLTFSDLQAPIVAELVQAGVAVHAFNQRNLAGILAMIRTLGALVGAVDKAELLVRSYQARLTEVAASVRGRPRPRVYFEEWDDPLISGICWVSELIEIAGGDDVFAELRTRKSAKESSGRQMVMAPDIILIVCGRRSCRKIRNVRVGCDPAVRYGRVIEIKSPCWPARR